MFFKDPFLRGLFLEGLIFAGAYLRREICISKSIGLACSGKEIYHFCLVLLCFREQIPGTSPRGSYIRRGDLTEGFCVTILRGLYLEGLIHGGAYFRNSTAFFLGIWHFSSKFPSRLTCKKLAPRLFKGLREHCVRSLFKFDPLQFINMQAGVSNQVERILEIHERKRTGVLVEIDEKPELPNNIIVTNFQSFP